mmetsp:Transcript_36514/g.60487  ORF Transcript_36514/g.60487 Transcript_36514/m.60487 type:complete len:126 (-) Transcript_36514:401-778(-)
MAHYGAAVPSTTMSITIPQSMPAMQSLDALRMPSMLKTLLARAPQVQPLAKISAGRRLGEPTRLHEILELLFNGRSAVLDPRYRALGSSFDEFEQSHPAIVVCIHPKKRRVTCVLFTRYKLCSGW